MTIRRRITTIMKGEPFLKHSVTQQGCDKTESWAPSVSSSFFFCTPCGGPERGPLPPSPSTGLGFRV